MELALARIELMKYINPDSIHWEMFKNDYLEKEKEQIKKANMDGYKEGCTYLSFDHRPKTTEEYYNRTYTQDRELPKDVTDLLENYKKDKNKL